MAKKKLVQQISPTVQRVLDDDSRPLLGRLIDVMKEFVDPADRIEHDADKTIAEQDLYQFMRQAWHVIEPANVFVDGWHIGCICEHLQAVTNLQIRKLIINIPPRHAKSLLASVFWFCWSWIKRPGSRWVYTAYGSNLSTRDSDKCRDLIKSKWYQDRWGDLYMIKDDEDTKQKFVNTKYGHRVATSVAGVGTGEGADVVVADDIHKVDDARSPSALDRAIYNWNQTMSTRGNDPKTFCQVVIMQRIAEGDLTGHLHAERQGYDCLCLPAEYEPKRYWFPVLGDYLPTPRDAITPTSLQMMYPELLDGPSGSGRSEDGDLLWPERFDIPAMENLKATLADTGTAGQLAQRPSPEKGTIFQSDHFRYFGEEMTLHGIRLSLKNKDESLPSLPLLAGSLRWFQTIDTAMTLKQKSAWTVVGTFARTPCGKLLVWDIWRHRIPVPKQYNCIKQLRLGRGMYDPGRRDWVIACAERPWPVKLLYQAVENKASGIGLIQEAQADGQPFKILKADQDKVQRSTTLATMFENGQVYFREAAARTWLTDYKSELLSFPEGAYKDQVDVTSYAAILCVHDKLTKTKHVSGDLIASGGSDLVVDTDRDISVIGDLTIDWEADRSWWAS